MCIRALVSSTEVPNKLKLALNEAPLTYIFIICESCSQRLSDEPFYLCYLVLGVPPEMIKKTLQKAS